MQIIDSATVAARLPWGALVEALEHMFRDGCTAPVRHAHTIPVPGAPDGSLLLMPAWQAGGHLGIKIVNIFPGNTTRGLPAVSAGYLLMDATTGEALALIDGEQLTERRTAAASALAARFLARADAARLVVVGAGRIARALALGHAALRPGLRDVAVWARDPARARALAAELASTGVPARATPDLEGAVREADIVSTATLSTEPLVLSEWVRPGTHLDLVGGFRPHMREVDDALVARARVCADTRAGALAEAGDLTQPIGRGLLAPDTVIELAQLCRGELSGRSSPQQVTLFKSVGAALEDLAAARLVIGAA